MSCPIIDHLAKLWREAIPWKWEHDGGFRIWVDHVDIDAPSIYVASVKHDPPRDGQGDCARRVADRRGDDWAERGAVADQIAALHNAWPAIERVLRAADRKADLMVGDSPRTRDEYDAFLDADNRFLAAIDALRALEVK